VCARATSPFSHAHGRDLRDLVMSFRVRPEAGTQRFDSGCLAHSNAGTDLHIYDLPTCCRSLPNLVSIVVLYASHEVSRYRKHDAPRARGTSMRKQIGTIWFSTKQHTANKMDWQLLAAPGRRVSRDPFLMMKIPQLRK
jgi:hypothetical protein